MSNSELQLLEVHIDALFTHAPDGRIRFVNEPDGDLAPRFFFGRTRAGNLWRFRYDLREDIVRRLEELGANEPVHDDLRAKPRNLRAFQSTLGEDSETEPAYVGPAYQFPRELPRPGNVTRITGSNLHLLRRMGPD